MGVEKGRKWCNRVPKVFVRFLGVFVRFLAVGSFCGVFGGWKFLWGFWQSFFT